MDWSLPAELAAGASVRGEEYGWEIACFPAALATAERLELACLGGQFQFRFDDAVYEMYWLSLGNHPKPAIHDHLKTGQR
jgi:hypothetical protein